MPTEPNDSDLIKRYLNGDSSALSILVKKWHQIFCQKAYWVLKDKELSKDVAQECWMIIIDKLPDLKNPDRFNSWALRIVYTKAIDAQKRRLKSTNDLDNLNTADDTEVDIDPEKTVLKQKLRTAIHNLSKTKQDIIRLFYMEEYSLKEISDFLNIPVGTVKSRLFKAREKLKSIIKSK